MNKTIHEPFGQFLPECLSDEFANTSSRRLILRPVFEYIMFNLAANTVQEVEVSSWQGLFKQKTIPLRLRIILVDRDGSSIASELKICMDVYSKIRHERQWKRGEHPRLSRLVKCRVNI